MDAQNNTTVEKFKQWSRSLRPEAERSDECDIQGVPLQQIVELFARLHPDLADTEEVRRAMFAHLDGFDLFPPAGTLAPRNCMVRLTEWRLLEKFGRWLARNNRASSAPACPTAPAEGHTRNDQAEAIAKFLRQYPGYTDWQGVLITQVGKWFVLPEKTQPAPED